jgi:lipopolysaccharide assembly outer membrane protein LptD (OstA)
MPAWRCATDSFTLPRPMKRILRYCSLAALCAGATAPLAAAETAGWVIRARSGDGAFEMDPNTGDITAPEGVIITYKDAVLSADKVAANAKTGDVEAQGSVTLKFEDPKKGDQLWTGDNLHYNFNTRAISSTAFKTGHVPVYIAGQSLTGEQMYQVFHGHLETNEVYHARNATITTDNYALPAQKIRAKRITFVPGEYIEAESATIYIGNTPVMYLPYYHRTLGEHPNNFAFLPGYRSIYGPYLFSEFNWHLNDELSGALHGDYYESRGWGYGPDFKFNLGDFGQGLFKYYYIWDHSPGLDPNTNAIPRDRKRLTFEYQVEPRTNFTVKAEIRYQSDAELTRDFFESEYRKNAQPSSFVEANQAWPNFTLNMLAQPQVDNFFETIERLPDVQFNALRQQLGETPFYYESQSDGAYLRRRFVDPAGDFEAARFDTFHQIVMPETFFGFLNFTPRIGERLTYYSQAEGPGATTTEETREVFNTGAEISTKASRTWESIESRFWDVNGIRHVIQPTVDYVYVPAPSVLPSQLPQFDYEIPTLRPLPIEYPNYNAIDSVDSQNVVRFSLYNRLQTKREKVIQNIVDWQLSLDWRIRPNPTQSTYGDLYSALALRPWTWLGFNSVARYDLNTDQWLESDSRIILQPAPSWSISLGHRYLASDPTLGPIYGLGNNTIYSSIYYRLNENWGMRLSHHFEAEDGIMQEQAYTIFRDFRSWTGAITVRYTENVGAPNDLTVAVTFSLKAMPRFALGQDADRPETLFGH